MDGALVEVGPFRVKDEKTLMKNPGAWNKDANLIFVDQPIGVGLSTSDTDSYIHELPEMAADMITFLEKYFEVFPEQQEHELFLAGESYAGQYIPYLADAINTRNKNLTEHPEYKDEISHINLKGIMIGNGWIDPAVQYMSYVPFAYDNGLVKQGSSIAATLEQKQRQCVQALSKLSSPEIGNTECDKILDTLLQELYQETKLAETDDKACVNVYDIRKTDTFSSCGMNWPPDLKSVTPYLRRQDVLNALNIDKEEQVKWKECSGPVGQAFKAKKSAPASTLIPGIISDGVEVLMFNGDQDLICNHVGNSKVIDAISWGASKEEASRPPTKGGHGGFKLENGETEESWYVDGQAAGTFQTGRNLTYIKVFNASHMVPFDLPEVSLAMVNQFIRIPGYDKESQAPKKEEDKGDTAPSDDESTPSDDGEQTDAEKKIEDATWKAYYRAGAVALVVVVLLTSGLVFFVWRSRRLVHHAMLLNEARPRGVHYEDGSRSGDSMDGFDDDGERPTGFLDSFFSGISRWQRPHHGRSLSRGSMAGAVPLSNLHGGGKRDSLDSMLIDSDEDSDEEANIGGSGNGGLDASGSRPYSDIDADASVQELVIERPKDA